MLCVFVADLWGGGGARMGCRVGLGLGFFGVCCTLVDVVVLFRIWSHGLWFGLVVCFYGYVRVWGLVIGESEWGGGLGCCVSVMLVFGVGGKGLCIFLGFCLLGCVCMLFGVNFDVFLLWVFVCGFVLRVVCVVCLVGFYILVLLCLFSFCILWSCILLGFVCDYVLSGC